MRWSPGRPLLAAVLGTALLSACQLVSPASDPLPSWRPGPARDAVLDFVARTTEESGPDFVAPDDRIAVFDNDGTLWAEQPVYFQLLFAIDRVQQLAATHPEWREDPALAAAIDGDLATLAAQGEEGLLKVAMTTHSGMTTDEFAAVARDWFRTARHPRTGLPYSSMVYQPMLELLDYLRANGFQTWIVSGGGVDFLRVFAPAAYGIPPQQTIGSRIKVELVDGDDGPTLVRRPELEFLDDKAGKPVAIHHILGRRPVAAFGNSDGDLQMLQWTAAGDGPRFCLLVHHTDQDREWAYDRASHVGKLDQALTEAAARGWTVVDMRADWATVFPD